MKGRIFLKTRKGNFTVLLHCQERLMARQADCLFRKKSENSILL